MALLTRQVQWRNHFPTPSVQRWMLSVPTDSLFSMREQCRNTNRALNVVDCMDASYKWSASALYLLTVYSIFDSNADVVCSSLNLSVYILTSYRTYIGFEMIKAIKWVVHITAPMEPTVNSHGILYTLLSNIGQRRKECHFHPEQLDLYVISSVDWF